MEIILIISGIVGLIFWAMYAFKQNRTDIDKG